MPSSVGQQIVSDVHALDCAPGCSCYCDDVDGERNYDESESAGGAWMNFRSRKTQPETLGEHASGSAALAGNLCSPD